MPAAVDGPETTAGPHVTVVLVSHNGAKWLPQVLDGLERQQRMPNALVAVDTGSTDESVDLLSARVGPQSVCRLRRPSGYGAAVAAGLEFLNGQPVEPRRHGSAGNPADPTRSWIWLLHDDSAPDPGALAALLAQVRDDVAIVGPKLREWPSLRRLLEVGATISGTGHRETGLERGEPDQGQHDRPRDVLAVNTAGMLIRRDVWNQLGGLERRLPVFGADLDIGWRVARAGYRTRTAPDAVVFHLEAASRGLRSGVRSAHAQERRAALFILLANASFFGFWWQSIRLLAGSILRAFGFLLAKAPREAVDELRAVAGVYLHPFAMMRARHRRRRQARRSPKDVRPLLPSPLLPYRHGVDAVLDIGLAVVRAAGGGGGQPQVSGKRAVVETGPVAAETEELQTGTGAITRVLRQPWTAVAVVLVLLSLWSARDLLGSGQLLGGALLPAPDGVGDWWGLMWQSWHPVGLGSDAPAAPYVGLLMVAGTVTLGQPWLLMDLLVLAAVPLTALTASRLARRIFDSSRVRMWWCLSYAALPILTGAVAQGRIGTLVGILVLPLVAIAAIRMFGGEGPLWLSALRLGLWLSLLISFVPIGYFLVGAGLVIAALVIPNGVGRRHGLLATVGVLVLPWLLLGQWMWNRVLDPGAVWWEAGLANANVDGTPIDPAPGTLDLVGGIPGGIGSAPAFIGLVVVALGVIALGRTDRRRLIATAWLVALAGLALAVLGAGQRIDVGPGAPSAVVWVGFPLACWLAGLALAAGLAADRVSDFLAGRSFGWRQPITVGASAVATVVPIVVAGWWLLGEDSALAREDPVPIPLYLAAQAYGPEQSSTLVLSGSPADGVGYQIVRDDGDRLGDETVLPSRSDVDAMNGVVADLLSAPDGETVAALLDRGIGAVYAPAPVDATVASALDGAAGLTRAGTTDPQARAWQAAAPSGAVRVLPQVGGVLDPAKAKIVSAPPPLVGTMDIPSGSGQRQLHMAAGASDNWSASGANGALKAVTTSSGTQGFAAPSDGGVTVSYDSSHGRWLSLRLVVAAVAIVLALPGRRRRT